MRLLNARGVFVSYRMTVVSKCSAQFVTWLSVQKGLKVVVQMGAVLTIGSRQEFKGMIELIKGKTIKTIVSRVVKGSAMPQIDGLSEDMNNGSQFGKLVVDLSDDSSSKLQYAPR